MMLGDNKDIVVLGTQQTSHQDGNNTNLERDIVEIKKALKML